MMWTLREAVENDYEGICSLIKTEDELFMVYPNGQYPLTVDQVRKLSQTREALTVAVDEVGNVIGFADLYNHEPGKTAFIGNVVVDPAHRGRGMGKAIVSHMLEKVFERYDLPEVRISVFSENTPALLLYSGCGFIPYEMEERRNPKGKRVALIHMRLERNQYEV
ncbi:MAG TPA: N-acetyltransferase [Thiolapillus brandeum]|uniref:N-acetyltransferase n=1 Tax=Thiolapillus brandeum TaxID=1076588 RepID=A0A831WC95_9GAMM|nr:N-acetyltransferase [Thiolapillus brandeum]